MTDTETVTQILEFTGSIEAEKFVLEGGAIEYSPDFDEYNTFKIQDGEVSLCILDRGWTTLKPQTDMNDAAFLTKALHEYLHQVLDASTTTRKQKIIYMKLHDMIIDVQKRFATLEMCVIYGSLREVSEQIATSLKWLQE